MIIVSNRIPVNPEHKNAFEETFKNRTGAVDGMPGFIAFNLLRPDSPEDPYVVMTFWESKEAYENWVNSEEFKAGHARSGTLPPETFLGHPKLEVSELIATTAKIERQNS
jgi:heme oxygenase (mycobilin-producing)